MRGNIGPLNAGGQYIAVGRNKTGSLAKYSGSVHKFDERSQNSSSGYLTADHWTYVDRGVSARGQLKGRMKKWLG